MFETIFSVEQKALISEISEMDCVIHCVIKVCYTDSSLYHGIWCWTMTWAMTEQSIVFRGKKQGNSNNLYFLKKRSFKIPYLLYISNSAERTEIFLTSLLDAKNGTQTEQKSNF